ncbi:Ig-like domain-containing protein [Vibrio neptunius]|uniref:Ig-like domain-containing protein n=1 Tax=Vibrio neptunius TaxID=170651 RepID=UPI003314EF85
MDKQFNVKDLLLLMTLTLIVLLLSGCGGSEEGASQTESSPPQSTPSSTRPQPSQTEASVQLERLTLTAFPVKTKGTSELTLITGNEQYFLAVGEYSNGQSKLLTEELTVEDWQSSDQTIGEFIQSGVLQSKASGVVSVAFSKDNLTSNPVEVKVTDATITDITITPSVVKLAKGHYQPLTAIATYNNGLSSDISDSVNWKPDVATTANVSTSGVLSGVMVGTTTVTAMKEGVTSNSVDVEVTNAVITDISVTPPSVSVAKGHNQSLQAKATYSDGTSSTISDSVTWIPNDSSIATVTSQGLLTGGKVGTTTLTAMKDGVTSNSIDLNVTNAVLKEITITSPSVSVAKGQKQRLTAMGTYSDGTTSDISDFVNWKATHNNIAIVTPKGLLSGIQAGATTLTAMKEGVTSNTVNVEVTNAVITDISVTPPTVSIAKGQKQRLTANATYSDNTSSDISDSVTWIPNDSNIANVTSKGLLAGGKVGDTTLTAMKDGITSNSIDVDVTKAVLKEITITPTSISVAKGQKQRLTAMAIYSDGTTSDISDFVNWKPDVATTANVSTSGVLSGVMVGTTTVTAMKEGVTSNSVDVEVTNAVITGISVTPSVVTIAKGQNQALTATATYSDNTSSDITAAVNWTSTNKTTATVMSTGLLKGEDVGQTTLSAMKDGVTSNPVGVVVSDAVITGISVTPPIVMVAKGQKQRLTANATYSDNTSSDVSASVTWIPVDSKTAIVTSQGLLSGGEVGPTTLTAIKNGVTSNTVTVDVTNAVLTGISVTPPTLAVARGQSERLTAMATYSDNTSSDISDFVSWEPIDNKKVSFTQNSLLTGEKVGPTTVTASLDGVTSNIVDVDVTNAVLTAISVTPPTVSIAKGQKEPLTATATYSDGTTSDISGSVSWIPVDNKPATITSNGLLTGANVGKTTLTAIKDAVTSNPVGVVVSDAVITGISVTPPNITVAKGQKQRLTANATYSDRTSSDISDSVSWVSVDTNTATMTSDGLLTGSSVGKTTLSAVKDGVTSNTVDVDVTNAVLTAISVTPPTVSIAKGQKEPLTATATYSDGTSSDISNSVSWIPVDNKPATITSNGLLTGANVGQTTLSAIKDEVNSNTVDVDVTNAVLTAISVTPPTVSIAKGQTEPMTATATYSDGTSSDISDSVSWIPVDNKPATITSNGLLTGANVGKTTLTAIKDAVTSNPVGVVVSDAVITGISVTPPSVTVAKGQKQRLTANATYSDRTSSDISDSVSWVSVDTNTATMTSDGLLTGSSVGKTTLSAVKDGVTSNTINVEVTSAVLTALHVTPTTISIAKGQKEPMTTTATYGDGTSSDISDFVSWKITDSNIATVTPKGLLAGSQAGATTLTAMKDGVTSSPVNVEVTDAVITDITVTPPSVSVAKGHNQSLQAKATYSDGTSSIVSDSVTWIPNDSSIANVTPKGLLAGGKVGGTTLTTMKDGVTSNTINVEVTSAVLTAISVTPTTLTVAKGQTEPLTAMAIYSDGTSSNISDFVSWVPLDTSTATVTDQGLLSGANVGTTTLTAVQNGITSNAIDVEVTDAVMTGLTLSPPLIGVVKGQTQAITVTANYSDGSSSDVSTSVAWWKSGDSTVSVSPQGLAGGSGSGTVTAAKNGFMGTVDIYVCNTLKEKCIDFVHTGNQKLFTSTPSSAYMEGLGLGGNFRLETKRDKSGSFYTFTWQKANELCAKYNTINLARRDNWRLPTLEELRDELYKSPSGWANNNGKYSKYWTSTKNYDPRSTPGVYWSVNISNKSIDKYYGKNYSLYASCVSSGQP